MTEDQLKVMDGILGVVLDRLNTIEKRVDTLLCLFLSHCDRESGECSLCGQAICPHDDIMHFHHDGCPSCDSDTQQNQNNEQP